MRLAVAGFVVLVAGCAAQPKVAQTNWNEQEKLLACLDLQDHIVDLYSTEYIREHAGDFSSSPSERQAFRDGWAEDLAKRGTFDRFEQTCFTSLTQAKYQCGMHASTTSGLVACMKFTA